MAETDSADTTEAVTSETVLGADAAPEQNSEQSDGDSANETTVLGADDSRDESSDEAGDGSDESEGDESKAEEAALEPFTLPEGFEAEGAELTAFAELAQADGLNQEQAQRYVDLAVQAMQRTQQAPMEAWNETLDSWSKELAGVPDQTKADARLAMERLGASAELKSFLDDTGFGNHPELVRVLGKAGSMFREDGFQTGADTPQAKSIAERLFPSHAAES